MIAARRTARIVASVLVAVLVAPSSALAWTVDPSSRSAEEIRTRYQQLKPVYSGEEYASLPSWVAPYAPGSLNADFLADGINTLNFYRYLAGLPDDVRLDATRNLDGQYGAVLLRASTFSHTPPQPSDMSDSFYDRGYRTTSSSNIGSGFSSLETFTTACMQDADPGNITRVGHRRWLLNPPMQVTGMGFADRRATTYAFDRSRSESVNYDFISWPTSGYMPVEYITSRTPWSVTLNPSRYIFDSPGTNSTVTLKRASDGRTWTLNSADKDTSGEYFTFNTSGYGISNAFIFRPDPATVSYSVGDSFTVTISGGIKSRSTGAATTVRFTTKIMTLDGPTLPIDSVERVWGSSRYTTAVNIARKGYDPAGDRSWPGVKHVVIASGEDRAAADPLAASGLCYTYQAPLFLVSATSTPAEVTQALKEIVAANGSVTVHIVGGTTSVPSARFYDIQRAVGSANASADRILSSGGRYDLAAAIARRVKQVSGTPATVLVANGADPSKFFDALALSPLAAAKGYPILLVQAKAVPSATAAALTDLKAGTVVVGGGAHTVSDSVYRSVGGDERWAGATRYSTSTVIAGKAIAKGWLSCGITGTAAKLPDALAGGSMCGKKGGVLLLTEGDALTSETGTWIDAHLTAEDSCYVFGGPDSVSDGVIVSIASKLL